MKIEASLCHEFTSKIIVHIPVAGGLARMPNENTLTLEQNEEI